MNEDNPLRGGIPNDNNMVEGGNAEDKKFRYHQRSKFVNFMDQFAHYLEDVSMRDLSFIGTMKEDVRSSAFFKSVYETCIRPHAIDKPSILSLRFSFSAVAHGVPHGSFICLGQKFLSENEFGCDKDESIQECLRRFRRHSPANLWMQHYKTMHIDPEQFCLAKAFDVLVGWHKTCHLCQPLRASAGLEVAAVVKGVHSMLANSGYPIIELEQLLALDHNDKCLIACDCQQYQKRAWCKHACAFALHRDIIQFPPNKDPQPVGGLMASKPGAPRKKTPLLVVDV